MCRTPAPPSTALVAAMIWSGTGDVKISPAQAASSMPGPTKPVCSGSWPEPPPEIRPTLPRTGASADRGDDLSTVASVARRVNERSRSFGIALSSCTPPAAGAPIFDLPEGQIEVGVGIHGEPGRRREPLSGAGELAELMLDAVLTDLDAAQGARVLTFVNGLGGTPQIELYLLYGEVDRRLRDAGLAPARNLVGSYITSLEMAGASLTLLELDDELIELWDAPVHTPALRWGA